MIRALILVGSTLLSTTSLAEINLYGETSSEYDGNPSDFRDIGMLPGFNAKVDPEATLRDYPLGVIPKRDAVSRHGAPHKIVILANGKEGWVYEIPYQRAQKRLTPEQDIHGSVQPMTIEASARTYTLMFDDGVVIDVIYKDGGPSIGVTATEMQAHKARLINDAPKTPKASR